MIRTYESFEELAKRMTAGVGDLHSDNCPGPKACIDWQLGVLSFAEWLDHIGVKVRISDKTENFYDFVTKGRAGK